MLALLAWIACLVVVARGPFAAPVRAVGWRIGRAGPGPVDVGPSWWRAENPPPRPRPPGPGDTPADTDTDVDARDPEGRLHEHSAICTHMGCVVRWNSLEACFDCPCHGSQFAAADGSVLNGPAIAEPTGAPAMFSDTETANARPNLPGSVRRCRSVRNAMSKGVSTRATATSAAATTTTDLAEGMATIPAAIARRETNISCLSRPLVRRRPTINVETNPAAPTAPHT